ncbi:MAG: type II toxin-antitoxin system HicA family toxin [Armatimonadota bacterium]
MKAYSSKDVIRVLESDGWEFVRCSGSHHIYKHDSKPGLVVVPHPKKVIPIGTLRSIAQQAGISL